MATVKMPKKYYVPPAARFLTELERNDLEEEIVNTLMFRIPRLYQIEFEDATEKDLPPELWSLIDVLERDFITLDFDEDEDEDEDEES